MLTNYVDGVLIRERNGDLLAIVRVDVYDPREFGMQSLRYSSKFTISSGPEFFIGAGTGITWQGDLSPPNMHRDMLPLLTAVGTRDAVTEIDHAIGPRTLLA